MGFVYRSPYNTGERGREGEREGEGGREGGSREEREGGGRGRGGKGYQIDASSVIDVGKRFG